QRHSLWKLLSSFLFPSVLLLTFIIITSKTSEKEDESLPIDIVLQTLLALAVTCYGIVHIAGEFKDMDATSELKNKTFDTLRNHPSFYVFNHHGRVLLGYKTLPSSVFILIAQT
uniref:Membrane magnesium transporter n=1 Tax=Bos taurus TaxID=9913 RepID=A0A3Q1NMV1_BOVIN